MRRRQRLYADPDAIFDNVVAYSLGTGTSGLRTHLIQYHREMYEAAVEETGWTRKYLEQTEAPDEPDVSAEPSNQRGDAGRVFVPNSDDFKKALVDFIIGDDQVCRL